MLPPQTSLNRGCPWGGAAAWSCGLSSLPHASRLLPLLLLLLLRRTLLLLQWLLRLLLLLTPSCCGGYCLRERWHMMLPRLLRGLLQGHFQALL